MSEKNELYISWNNFGYLYYETNCQTAKDAFNELKQNAENTKINIDNFPSPDIIELRTLDGDIIDKIRKKSRQKNKRQYKTNNMY